MTTNLKATSVSRGSVPGSILNHPEDDFEIEDQEFDLGGEGGSARCDFNEDDEDDDDFDDADEDAGLGEDDDLGALDPDADNDDWDEDDFVEPLDDSGFRDDPSRRHSARRVW